MTDDDPAAGDLVAAAHENYRAAFVGLAEERPDGVTRQFGPIIAVSAGLPVPEYNRAFVFDTPSRDELASAVSWLETRGDPCWVTITAPVVEALGHVPEAFDLVECHSQPAMVRPSLAEIPSRASPAAIVPVTDATTFDEFVSVYSSVFDRSTAVTDGAYRPSVSDEHTHLFVGRLEGRPVACGVLFGHDGVAGVYAIGVLEGLRRRGLGKRMTETVLLTGRDAGCRIGALQPSEMAISLYERMGFEQVGTYHHFEPAH